MQKLIPALLGCIVFSAAMPISALADTPVKNMAMSGKLSVSAAFNPNPPKQGAETIVVQVKDATGKPLKGAIVKVASDMPTMSMGGPTIVAHDNGDGSYAAKLNVNFATMWVFKVSAVAGKQKGSTQLKADIK